MLCVSVKRWVTSGYSRLTQRTSFETRTPRILKVTFLVPLSATTPLICNQVCCSHFPEAVITTKKAEHACFECNNFIFVEGAARQQVLFHFTILLRQHHWWFELEEEHVKGNDTAAVRGGGVRRRTHQGSKKTCVMLMPDLYQLMSVSKAAISRKSSGHQRGSAGKAKYRCSYFPKLRFQQQEKEHRITPHLNFTKHCENPQVLQYKLHLKFARQHFFGLAFNLSNNTTNKYDHAALVALSWVLKY